jgi:hypothetical protein
LWSSLSISLWKKSRSKSEKKFRLKAQKKSHSRSHSENSFDGGLDKTSLNELNAAGGFDYLDRFTPIGVEVGEGENPDYQTFLQNSSATFDGYKKELKHTDFLGFTKFTWDPLPNGIIFPLNDSEDENPRNGPSCISGTPYSAYSRAAPRATEDDSSDNSEHHTLGHLLIFLQGRGKDDLMSYNFMNLVFVPVLSTCLLVVQL